MGNWFKLNDNYTIGDDVNFIVCDTRFFEIREDKCTLQEKETDDTFVQKLNLLIRSIKNGYEFPTNTLVHQKELPSLFTKIKEIQSKHNSVIVAFNIEGYPKNWLKYIRCIRVSPTHFVVTNNFNPYPWTEICEENFCENFV